MNNASFHLSAQMPGCHHPLMMLPNNNSPPNSTRLMQHQTAADSVSSHFTMPHHNNASSPPTSQMSPLNFSQRDLSQRDLLQRDLLQFGHQMNAGFPYLNGFTGLPMMPMGFGLFPQHHGLFTKSPGMMSSMPGFFNNFSVNKDDDLLWNKRSPSNFPDSPRSGSRSSPMENMQQRKKLSKGKSPSELNVCPICGETISGKSLQEHFFEEIKTYRQEPLSARDVSSSSPAMGVASRHAHDSPTPTTPSEVDSRHEIFMRVRANRRARQTAPSSGDHASTNRRLSNSSERQRYSHSMQRMNLVKNMEIAHPEETDVIVDVEAEDVKEPSESTFPGDLSPSTSRATSTKSPSLPGKKRPLQDLENENENEQILIKQRSGNIRSRSCSVDSNQN